MLDTLGGLESQSNYQAVSRLGFLGKYQLGEAILFDLGYYTNDPSYYGASFTPDYNDWIGTWTGKDGVSSRQEFLANENNTQETAIRGAFGKNIGYLVNFLAARGRTIESYIGTTKPSLNGATITLSGILAGAHLRGAGNMANFLLDGTPSPDEDGTPIEFYIQVFGGFQIKYTRDQNGNYIVSDSGGTTPPPTDPNGTFTTAQDLGTIPIFVSNADINSNPTTPDRVTGDIGSTYNYGVDKDDFYKITLSSANYLAASISELSGNAGIAIYNSDRTLLSYDNKPGSEADTVRQYLNTGTYYVHVYQNTPVATNYKLSVIAHKSSESGFANNTDLGTFNGDQITRGGAIGVVNENDFFRFKVNSSFTGSSLSVKLLNLTSDADILVYDSAFGLLGKSLNDGTVSENVTLNRSSGLKAGDTYYVQVNPFGSGTPTYNVQVSV
ncbi:MAG: hypothetical protein HC769_22185 [Cyanobacteria bacterium CRU_2_1]|nr:hypothetical protein [Cyanobacteria bacterium CRU_2_1]